MTPILKTQRLTLRPVTIADAEAITATLSKHSVRRWLSSVPSPYTIDDAYEYITNTIPKAKGRCWAIDAGSGLVGMITIRGQLGYWLSTEIHGKGYMTEAAMTAVDDYFQSTDDDLTSGYHLGNAASANVLTKLGFAPTYIDAPIQVSTGEPVDTQQMVLTKAKWNAR